MSGPVGVMRTRALAATQAAAASRRMASPSRRPPSVHVRAHGDVSRLTIESARDAIHVRSPPSRGRQPRVEPLIAVDLERAHIAHTRPTVPVAPGMVDYRYRPDPSKRTSDSRPNSMTATSQTLPVHEARAWCLPAALAVSWASAPLQPMRQAPRHRPCRHVLALCEAFDDLLVRLAESELDQEIICQVEFVNEILDPFEVVLRNHALLT